jgi:hypothetical protein
LDIFTNLTKEAANNLIKLLDLQGYLDSEVLYFPTFRRIETDLSHFNLSAEAVNQITFSKNLNFGMGDVEKLLEFKLKIIDTSIRQGFNKMTTTLLRQYVNNDDLYSSHINDEELKVILNILSDSLPETLVVKIGDMMKTKKIYNKNNEQLLNLLNCLMKIYEEQKCNINSIEKFVDVCNKYFCNKSLLFKKDSLSVEILDNNKQIIQFSNLSSGEKQMVSIFSKLYLETEKKYFILFDEPELSLSIEWQRMLIPDIMNAECVNQLLAVTHSPFIFDNQYDKNANSL